MPPKLFSFTQFPKNASATPLVSHTFKTKDLKPFRFTHFQKKGGGYPHFPPIPTPPCQCDSSQGGVSYPTSNAKPPTSALHSGILIRDNGILHRMNTLRILRLRQTAIFLALLLLCSVSGRAQAPHAPP